jgi:hypothetical protein
MPAGLDLLKHRDEVLQIFFDGGNLVRSIFNRFPELVKLDASFGELERNGDHCYTCIQLADGFKIGFKGDLLLAATERPSMAYVYYV